MSQVDQLEKQLTDVKTLIQRRRQMIKLIENPDFKELILEYYCVQECARYVQASVDASMPEDARKDALFMAQSAGNFKRFVQVVLQMGFTAENSVGDLEDAIVEARNEEDQV